MWYFFFEQIPMKRNYFILLLLLFCWSCKEAKKTGTFIRIETQFGDIHLQLYPEKAPKTVGAFLSYIDSGFYTNSTFYRVLKAENQPSNGFKSELIQGGIYQSNYGRSIKLKGIPHESTLQTKLTHQNGTISLARTTPGTASSEFFICIGNQPAYDYGGDANPDKLGFAAFGKVIKGFETLKKIHTQTENGEDFDPPVKIINITRE